MCILALRLYKECICNLKSNIQNREEGKNRKISCFLCIRNIYSLVRTVSQVENGTYTSIVWGIFQKFSYGFYTLQSYRKIQSNSFYIKYVAGFKRGYCDTFTLKSIVILLITRFKMVHYQKYSNLEYNYQVHA